MKKAIFLFMLLPFLAQAQDEKGIHFEHELSWTAIQAKAKAENKYIFMDCFTTWCGPCRFMAAEIFPLDTTGKYFNDKFISVKVQLDTTAKDAGNIKTWYAAGHDIAVRYGVNAYPTYLVFAPDGHVVHRFVGAAPVEKFLANAAGSFDSTRQYYTLQDQYKNGRRDSAFLHKLAMACMEAYDPKNGKPVAEDYLATQTDLFTRDALYLEDTYTKNSTDKYFSTFIDHPAEVDKVLGPKTAETKIRDVYLSDITGSTGQKPGDKTQPDWTAVHSRIAAKLPADADELTSRLKIGYYRYKKEWPSFEKAMVAYMKTYGDHLTDPDLNDIAWSVFQQCPDMSCVSEVLDWSKRLKDNSQPAFMDTYANILYKLGKKDEAIALEAKAIGIIPDLYKASYQETLDKMKKGEKTW